MGPALHWARYRFKGNKVYARVDEAGTLVPQDDGRVEIRYKPDDPRSYSASPDALFDVDDPEGIEKGRQERERRRDTRRRAEPAPEVPPGTIAVFTDGACSGNPGPAGWGAVLRYRQHVRELSGYIGKATNNVAELTAIREGLCAITKRDRPVWVYTDSAYALGVLNEDWNARANQQLVADLRDLVSQFAEIRFLKVKGHSGVPDNERADELARLAVQTP